jgi:hypothetical protein
VQFGQNLPELLCGTWVKFSPDGEKLAVHVLREEGSNGDLWLLGYPSGTGRILWPQLRMDSASWLPDSRRLVFGPKGEFSILDTANGSVRLMYRSPTGIANPSASRWLSGPTTFGCWKASIKTGLGSTDCCGGDESSLTGLASGYKRHKNLFGRMWANSQPDHRR